MSDTAEDPTYGPVAGLLSAVMASCGDAIIACSVEGRIEAWSQSAANVYGYTSQEAVGETLELIVPPERVFEIKKMADAASRGEATKPFDTVRIRRCDEAFPVSVSAFPVRGDGGEFAGYVVVEKEVSGLVRSADELRKALASAEEASSAKSRFLANASHELRTPMNAIVGMTALALEEEISPELRDYLETIRDSSDSMLHLINDVLDLSKFEADRFELDETAFDPRELVEATIKVLGAAAHAKGLELVCRVTPTTPAGVVGDPTRLRQVLTNLIGNAIKFTASGEVVVEVEPIAVEKRRCRLAFRVIDSGIGISAEDQDRIFAPFTQVDGATTRRYAGTGLGLTITQHLIDCFGGELDVTSSLGEGSTFSFELTFPLAEESDNAAANEAAARLRGLTVLVVDDNEASRSALVEQFRSWEMKPTAVATGREALERLARTSEEGEQGFNLAVIDALMPGIDGFSVAAKVEADERITAKPILMASTTDRLEFSRRCAEAGAAAFVQKPVSQSQLLSAVVEATGAAALGGESRQGLFQLPEVAPLRVLLVEDTPANRKVVQRVLTKRGHHLEMAVNGREALDAFRNGQYDVVLMDIQMPIMDGFQATEAIREIEHAAGKEPAVPIVAMTAHSMRGDRERCLRAGMDGYLSKPLDLQQLIDVVEAYADPSVGLTAAAIDEPAKTASVPSDETQHDPADLVSALRRLRGDRGLLVDMIGFFEEDAPTLLQTVQAAIEQGNLEEVQRAAHSLKGLAATFDASAAIAAARDLETASRDGAAESLPAGARRLAAEVDRLCQQLTAYRESQSI